MDEKLPHAGGPPRERAAAELASRQHGNITYRQLRALGFQPGGIAHRVARGRLVRVHYRVYAWGRPHHLPLERAAAAVLAGGAHALLGCEGALVLWGFATAWPERFDLILTAGDARPRGIVTHRIRGLTRADIACQHGIPCTSPARTILDCVPRTPTHRRTRLVQDALLSPYLSRDALIDVIARFSAHPGTSPLSHLLDAGETRSPKEDEFVAFCGRYGLPRPQTNVRVAGHRVDALFAQQRLIVEFDGWETHRERWSFESDRDRDADTLAAGHATVRVTHERLHHRPQAEADRLLAILAQRASGPGPGRAGG